jgi:hypothetical protein
MALGETPTLADAKADIYINTGILCQATLRESQQNTAMVCITALNIVYLTI